MEVGYEKCKNEKFGKFFSSNNPFFLLPKFLFWTKLKDFEDLLTVHFGGAWNIDATLKIRPRRAGDALLVKKLFWMRQWGLDTTSIHVWSHWSNPNQNWCQNGQNPFFHFCLIFPYFHAFFPKYLKRYGKIEKMEKY